MLSGLRQLTEKVGECMPASLCGISLFLCSLQESSTVAAQSASGDYGNSSSTSASAVSSPSSTARASTTSYVGTSVNSNGTGWFWRPSAQIKPPSSLPNGCILEPPSLPLPSSGRVYCECCQSRGHGLQGFDEVKEHKSCLGRDGHSDVGGYVRSSDVDETSNMVCSASPTAELLSLDDLFCRKFTVDNRHKGRMLLVQPQSTVEVDSESDDMTTSAREARSERGATASTLSLNDLLDDDTGSSDPSTPEGCDNLSISDYEQLVVGGCSATLADSSSFLPPPPLSLLRNRYSPSTQAKYIFIPVRENKQHADSSTDSSDYTNLADNESVTSGLQNPWTSCVAGSSHDFVSTSKLVNGMDWHSTVSHQSEKTHTCPTNSHMSEPNGIHRPTVLLTRRRKRASLAASAIVHSIQQTVDSSSGNCRSERRPLSKSNSCGPRTVLLYKDSLDGNGAGSSDDCPSLESLDQLGFRSSDGGDTVVCEKPFSSQDDGYCTAKSSVAVQLACCQQLSKITSSSEVDSSVDGRFLQDLSEVDDFKSASVLPEYWTSAQNENSDCFVDAPFSHIQLESSHSQMCSSQTQQFGLADSFYRETDVAGAGSEQCSSRSSLKPFRLQSGLPLHGAVVETCRLPSESVDNHTSSQVGDGFSQHSVRHEIDGDVQQAIDMFAFLDDQDSSANAASSSSQ